MYLICIDFYYPLFYSLNFPGFFFIKLPFIQIVRFSSKPVVYRFFFYFPDDEAPLNLSLKNPPTSLRRTSHSIWSPGSLCEKEDADRSPGRRSPQQDQRPDSSSSGGTSLPPRWASNLNESVEQVKIVSIGPGGERTFKVSRMNQY